jgi:hypothetical protein
MIIHEVQQVRLSRFSAELNGSRISVKLPSITNRLLTGVGLMGIIKGKDTVKRYRKRKQI